MSGSFNSFLKQLYETQYEKMFQVAYRMTGSVETTQDLVQDAFLLALFQQEKLAQHPFLEGWLMITVKNLALNERRKGKRHPTVPLDSLVYKADRAQECPLEAILPRQLKPEEKQILLWRFEDRLDYREIADRLGISETACRSRVSRSVARCRKYLEQP